MAKIDWSKWSAIAEIVSSAAILLTLVYLALQTQQLATQNRQLVVQTEQNNRILRAQAADNVLTDRLSIRKLVISDPEFASFYKKFEDGEPLSETEAYRIRSIVQTLVAVIWQSPCVAALPSRRSGQAVAPIVWIEGEKVW